MQIDPRIAHHDTAELAAVYRAIRNVTDRDTARAALADMDEAEFAEHFDNAADDGFYRP